MKQFSMGGGTVEPGIGAPLRSVGSVHARPGLNARTGDLGSLRVAMVCNRFAPHFGGVETHVAHLAAALASFGVRVDILTQEVDRHLAPVERQGDVIVRRFRSIVPGQDDAPAPSLWGWIARRRDDYDLMHFHSYHAFVSAASLVARPPVVFTPHYHGTGHSMVRAALHGPYRLVGRRVFRHAAGVICVSDAESELVRSHFHAEVSDKIQVVPNGVDLREMRKTEPTVMTTPYFLSLGRLERYKRVDRVIDAMTEVPEPTRLIVVGCGPARAELAALATDRGLARRIVFTEGLPRAEVRGLLAGAQAVVSMSEHEAFGLTLLEGLAAGRRVIASDIPAHREVSDFGAPDSVQLVAPSSHRSQLAAAMRDCLASSRDLDRGALVPSWDDVGRQTLEVYRHVAAARSIAAGVTCQP